MEFSQIKLGDVVSVTDIRNTDLSITLLLGISNTKKMIPSIANINGTDLSTYKIVKKNQFAYIPTTSRNGDKVSIAMLKEANECIVSSSYITFEIVKPDIIDADYLMLFFGRPEFDRYARFNSWGTAREVFSWEDFCSMTIAIPSLDEQKKFVRQYNTIINRIDVLERLNKKLEDAFMISFKILYFGEKDFEYGKMKDLIQLKRNTIQASDVKSLPYAPIDALPKHSLLIKEYSPSHEAQSSLITFEPFDILIGAMRVYFHRVCLALEHGVTRSTCFVLKPYNELYRYYAVGLCNLEETIAYANAHSEGTTMPYAVWDNGLDIYNIKIITDENKILSFNQSSDVIFKNIKRNIDEIKVLTILKKQLVSKL